MTLDAELGERQNPIESPALTIESLERVVQAKLRLIKDYEPTALVNEDVYHDVRALADARKHNGDYVLESVFTNDQNETRYGVFITLESDQAQSAEGILGGIAVMGGRPWPRVNHQ